VKIYGQKQYYKKLNKLGLKKDNIELNCKKVHGASNVFSSLGGRFYL